MQADSHADVFLRWTSTVVLIETPLNADSAFDRRARRGESDHEAVAHRLHFVPAVLLDLASHQLALNLQANVRCLVSATRPQVGRLYDVGEEERDRALRQDGCHEGPSTTRHARTFSPTPLSACSSRSSNATPADVRARDRTVSDTSTSPGAESPLMREAMFTAPP